MICVGVLSPLEKTLMDEQIFHPCAPSYMSKSVEQLYAENERSKKRAYNARVINIEKASFVPLVFSTHGGIGPECRTLMKRVQKFTNANDTIKIHNIMIV